MKGPRHFGFIRNIITITFFSILLGACLMSEEESKSTDPIAVGHELSGSVGDGPIIGASMRILQKDGVELAQFESDSNANYRVTVQADGAYYPLMVESRYGIDIVTNTEPDFDMLGAVLEPSSSSVANVNPFSTFIVELARDMPGGVTMENIQGAQTIVTRELNNGLRSLINAGVMTTRIDSGNAAEIVRASEALGETVRRARSVLDTSGFPKTADDVVRAVSSDLTDGVVDGRGGSRTDARVAAVWTIAAAQVSLETLANELHVYHANATQLMSNAADLVAGTAASPTLSELTATSALLEKTTIGLEASYAVSQDPRHAELLSAVVGIQPGTDSSTVRNFGLPNDYRGLLNSVTLLVAGGSAAVIETVNSIARGQTPTVETGSTTLNWIPPTQNDDGSTLSDLAGFKLYWRAGSGSYSNPVTINDANATSYVVNNLAPGTYEFVATSFTTAGIESQYSSPVTRVVQ